MAKNVVQQIRRATRRLLGVRFCTNEGIGFSKRTAQRLVKRVANRAMITKPVTPHVLRHRFAVHCVKNGVSTSAFGAEHSLLAGNPGRTLDSALSGTGTPACLAIISHAAGQTCRPIALGP